jgi:hypothetical protein
MGVGPTNPISTKLNIEFYNIKSRPFRKFYAPITPYAKLVLSGLKKSKKKCCIQSFKK